MPSKRSQIMMTDDEVQAYLDAARILNVATLGPTGHPHLVAMWFTMIGGNPVFWTFSKSQKIVNL
jgi:nitroimidazol reductase NimA-like FMN-containing flavoprotein (pyridoxamine 5'-phosphate oxidase superfamily)